jgi:hypothetical protein
MMGNSAKLFGLSSRFMPQAAKKVVINYACPADTVYRVIGRHWPAVTGEEDYEH